MSGSATESSAAPPSRMQKLLALGKLGAVVHFVCYLLCIAIFTLLIELGFRDPIMAGLAWLEGFARAHLGTWLADKLAAASDGGMTLFGMSLATLGGAVVATKVLSIPRMMLTAAITPAIARRLAARSRSEEAPPG